MKWKQTTVSQSRESESQIRHINIQQLYAYPKTMVKVINDICEESPFHYVSSLI